MRREDVHGLFSMVLQDTWLFEGTVRENLVYNMEGITEEQLENVCRACGLDKFIDTLVKAIEQNIDNSEFGIQELCEISRYSYQQVYRKVKALTGESINEFIRTVRLKRAAQYLAQSDTRISEIMYSVGFNSHSYFTKCFREHFGLSPKEYAEKHRRK